MNFSKNKIEKQTKSFITFILVLSLVFFGLFYTYQEPHALTPKGVLPFGGTVTTVFPCLNGVWTTILPVGGFTPSIISTPGGLYFGFGPAVKPGQKILGNVGPIIPCLIPTPFGPIPAGFGNIVLMSGTSAPSPS